MQIVSGSTVLLFTLSVSVIGVLGCGSKQPVDKGNASAVAPTDAPAYSCEQAQLLIERGQNELPSTYDEVIKYPSPCRGLLVTALAPATQSMIWRTHFERYTLGHRSLTSEQRAVVERAKELVSAEFFSIPHGSPEWSTRVDLPIRNLEKQAREVFGAQETAFLFGQIGPVLPTSTTEAPSRAQ